METKLENLIEREQEIFEKIEQNQVIEKKPEPKENLNQMKKFFAFYLIKYSNVETIHLKLNPNFWLNFYGFVSIRSSLIQGAKIDLDLQCK